MNYTDFFSGVGVTLILMACIWLIRTVRTDPVPEIPQKPRRKYKARKKPVDQNAVLVEVAGMTPPESAASTTA